LNVVLLQVNEVRNKVAAKEQQIADLQKKAQVIVTLFFNDFLSFVSCLLKIVPVWSALGVDGVLIIYKTFFIWKLQKLEDDLGTARKVSSERQLAVTDVCLLLFN
jgi:hypothetical protein